MGGGGYALVSMTRLMLIFAQLCDVFVSEDKRMRFKTEAVYSYLGINTQVVSLKEFKDISANF